MANTVIHYELTDAQQKKYDEWASHIKALYGQYGTFTWSITSYGIGDGIKVYSDLAKTELDLTDVGSW